MNVLVCGAGGFIGRHSVQQLRENGHTVREGRSSQMDFGRDIEVSTWLPRLEGLDAVINAVGVLHDSRARPMNAVHHLAPEALFRACAQRGLRRVIHISALGIDGNPTLYARSKLRAESVLRELQEGGRLSATILRPSIIFGREGVSSRLFVSLARLPMLPLPRAALRTRIQPVAVQDLAEACEALLRTDGPERLDCVGARRLTLAEFVASLRAQLGFTPAKVLPLFDWLSRASARCGDFFPSQPWCTETLTLLQQDNVGEGEPFASLLRKPVVPPQHLVATSWIA
jgi:uncharacterized protein YbjT (DUF2867 family)